MERYQRKRGDCIVCLEMRTDELMRRLISGELTNYRVVHTRPKPLQHSIDLLGVSLRLSVSHTRICAILAIMME
jgi:hypothetical protein